MTTWRDQWGALLSISAAALKCGVRGRWVGWNFDEDRGRIRTGHGPENVNRLRRFAVGVLTIFSKGSTRIAEKMATLNRKTRLVFDYPAHDKNSTRQAAS